MKVEKLKNRDLDELVKRVVAAGKPASGDIDRIVSDPRLFDKVMARLDVAVEELDRARTWPVWKPAVATTAFASVLAFLSVLSYLETPRVSGPVASGDQQQQHQQLPPPSREPYKVVEKPLDRDFVRAAQPEDERPRAEHAVLRRPVVERPEERRVRPSQQPRMVEPEPAFHPIGSPERAMDAALDERIVRVEIPRATLFAMGVNIPLENGSRNVKADLLVGADGTPRAIRLID